MLDVSDVPFPGTSDSDGDHDPLKLMEYYTAAVNAKAESREKERSGTCAAVNACSCTWGAAPPPPPRGPRTGPTKQLSQMLLGSTCAWPSPTRRRGAKAEGARVRQPLVPGQQGQGRQSRRRAREGAALAPLSCDEDGQVHALKSPRTRSLLSLRLQLTRLLLLLLPPRPSA
jgi:hypothetical protein